jgi:hypothetical protein
VEVKGHEINDALARDSQPLPFSDLKGRPGVLSNNSTFQNRHRNLRQKTRLPSRKIVPTATVSVNSAADQPVTNARIRLKTKLTSFMKKPPGFRLKD